MAPGTHNPRSTPFSPVNANRTATAAQFEAAQPPKDAISSLVFSPFASRRLLVSSWDKNVYLYEVADGAEEANLVGTFAHRAPVLDVCFGADDDEAFFAGMDHQVNRFVSPPRYAQIRGGMRVLMPPTIGSISRPGNKPS